MSSSKRILVTLVSVLLIATGCNKDQESKQSPETPKSNSSTVTAGEPMDRTPQVGEQYNRIESESDTWSAHNEINENRESLLVLTSSEATIRILSGAYPVAFSPDDTKLLVVAGDGDLVGGLEILYLDNPEGERTRLTNQGIERGPGGPPSGWIPAPLNGGEWITPEIFEWFSSPEGAFRVNVITGEVEGAL